MTKDQCKQILSDYVEAEVQQRVKEVHADLVAECASLQRQLQDAEELGNAEHVKLGQLQELYDQLHNKYCTQSMAGRRILRERDEARAKTHKLLADVRDTNANLERVTAERDAARDEGRHLIRELCDARDKLSHLRDELEFYRADSGSWRGLYEREKRLRLDERQQLMEEGGIDHFWAMMSRVMQLDTSKASTSRTDNRPF